MYQVKSIYIFVFLRDLKHKNEISVQVFKYWFDMST